MSEITRKDYLAAVQTVKKYHRQERKKKKEKEAKGLPKWKCKKNLYMSVSGDLIFKEGVEYQQVKALIRGEIAVIDERGDKHIICSPGSEEDFDYISNFTKIEK